MANTAAGLETPSADEAVNSEAGFAAALAGKGVEPEEGETSADTSIALGLETVEPAQGRDPGTGQFTAKSETSPPAPDTSAAGAAPQLTSDDERVAAYLEKYNGDAEAALKAAAHQTDLVGRQGTELSGLRETVAKLTGIVETLQATATAPATRPQLVLNDEQVEERAQGLVTQHGGYQGAATVAANESLQGDTRVYDSLVEQWALENPIQAQRFDMDFQLWKREQSAPSTAPAPDPWVESRKAAEGIEGTIATLAKELGTSWATVSPKMEAALDSMPPQVAAMIGDDDPEIRLAGVRLVADRATLLAGAQPPNNQGDGEGDLPESVKRKLSGSSVVTAGLRPAPAAPQGQVTKEDAIKAFKSEIMSAETTSVASGLTYGK